MREIKVRRGSNSIREIHLAKREKGRNWSRKGRDREDRIEHKRVERMR